MAKLGFHFLAYDHVDKAPYPPGLPAEELAERREQAGADRIAALLASEPDARILIHVGYSHLSMKPMVIGGRKIPTLAMRLKQIVGDRLHTIDQIVGTPASTPILDSAYLTAASALGAVKSPTILRTPGGAAGIPGHLLNYADDLVLHPAARYEQTRPDWLLNTEGLRRVEYRVAAARDREVRILQAIPEAEWTRDGVASDIVPIRRRMTAASFVLPPGRYQVVGETDGGLIPLDILTA